MKILIIVAHPDDETIGCGGAIVYHKKLKHKIEAVSFTDGVSARNLKDNKLNDSSIIKLRRKNSILASKILGFKWLENFKYPDNELDSISILNIVKKIEQISKKFKPDIVYTHHIGDLNIDHHIISKACLTAFRPLNKNKKTEIRFFEIPSSTDFAAYKISPNFKPNLFIDISKFWQKKKSALLAYKKEMMSYPNSRSISGIENLAKYRGNSVGLKMAESFEITRKIIS